MAFFHGLLGNVGILITRIAEILQWINSWSLRVVGAESPKQKAFVEEGTNFYKYTES